MLVGYALIGLGICLDGSFTLFATILLAQVLWGVGYIVLNTVLVAGLSTNFGIAAVAFIKRAGRWP